MVYTQFLALYPIIGSRIDLLLPAVAEIAVQVKDVVRGGGIIVAFLKEPPGA